MPFLADKTYIILTTMSKHHTSDCMSFGNNNEVVIRGGKYTEENVN